MSDDPDERKAFERIEKGERELEDAARLEELGRKDVAEGVKELQERHGHRPPHGGPPPAPPGPPRPPVPPPRRVG